MSNVVSPSCVYPLWLNDYLLKVNSGGADSVTLQNALVTLIQNMDCNKVLNIWDKEWACVATDPVRLKNIFDALLNAYGKDALANLFSDMWETLTNDELNKIGNLLKGRVTPRVCDGGGLEVIESCSSPEQGITLYCLRVKISGDENNNIVYGNDGGLYSPKGLSCVGEGLEKYDSGNEHCVKIKLSPNRDNLANVDDSGGLLVVAPAAKATYVYVSNEGSNTLEDGSPRLYSSENGNDQFFSIDAAIASTANGTSVNLYLKAGQTFIFDLNGIPRSEVQVGSDIVTTYWGSRIVNVLSYGDSFLATSMDYIARTTGDGTPAYCLENIFRPTILINWMKANMLDDSGNYVYKQNSYYAITGEGSVLFQGIRIAINDVDGLEASGLRCWGGWFMNGFSLQFRGCVFGRLPTVDGQYLIGSSAANTVINFSYYNNFESLRGIFVDVPIFTEINNANIVDKQDEYTVSNNQKFKTIADNSVSFLTTKSNYSSGYLTVIEDTNLNTKKYKFFSFNYPLI